MSYLVNGLMSLSLAVGVVSCIVPVTTALLSGEQPELTQSLLPAQPQSPNLESEDSPQQEGEALFARALAKTQKQDLSSAIVDLREAGDRFAGQGRTVDAYKSQALALYLQAEAQVQQAPNQISPFPSWYHSTRCVEPACTYSIRWVTPTVPGNPQGGILVLEKNIGQTRLSNGAFMPITAALDVEVVPPLQKGEEIKTACQINAESTDPVSALVQVKDYGNRAIDSRVRQAWKADLKAGKLEAVPAESVTCDDPCPGGC